MRTDRRTDGRTDGWTGEGAGGRTRTAILFSTFDFERRGVMEEGIIRRMGRARAGAGRRAGREIAI